MRFLLVSHVAPPHIGGVENLVLAEATMLAEAGHDVVWLTSDAGGQGQVPAPHARLRIERLAAWHGIERRFGIAYPIFSPRLLWRLWSEVGRADVVHAHGLVFIGSPPAMVFARCARKWTVCTDHGGLLRYPSRVVTFGLRVLFATVGRVTAAAAHRLIAYNTDVERLLRNLAGDAANVRFVRNPVDTAIFHPPSPAERAAARAALGWDDRPHVLCIARLLPHKGIDVLLAAREPGWQLVFCGPGEAAAAAARIRASGALCLSPRPRAELLALYHAADAFALPSHNEGFPVVIQEALACGLPVLTTDAPAYAPYRATPGLHLCEPSAAAVRDRLR
ncbi:MAG: glycosyltransferase family 4 protein, partial [Planctomycetota bacterium]